jgi:hypothetical protein
MKDRASKNATSHQSHRSGRGCQGTPLTGKKKPHSIELCGTSEMRPEGKAGIDKRNCFVTIARLPIMQFSENGPSVALLRSPVTLSPVKVYELRPFIRWSRLTAVFAAQRIVSVYAPEACVSTA